MKSVTGHARWQVTGMYATFNFRFSGGSRLFRTADQSTFRLKVRRRDDASQTNAPAISRAAGADGSARGRGDGARREGSSSCGAEAPADGAEPLDPPHRGRSDRDR